MTQQQLEQLAQVDIRYFMLAHAICPTCKRKFDQMHPLENLLPHWNGTCGQPQGETKPAEPRDPAAK